MARRFSIHLKLNMVECRNIGRERSGEDGVKDAKAIYIKRFKSHDFRIAAKHGYVPLALAVIDYNTAAFPKASTRHYRSPVFIEQTIYSSTNYVSLFFL